MEPTPRRPPDVQLQHHEVRRAARSWPSTATARCWQHFRKRRRRLRRRARAPRHRPARTRTRCPRRPEPPARGVRSLAASCDRSGSLPSASTHRCAARRGAPPAPPRRAAARSAAVGRALAWLARSSWRWCSRRWHRPACTGAGRAPRSRRWTARRALPGLAAPVTVRRDALGVPHLRPASSPRCRARAGLRDRAGPPLADGPHAPPRARRAGGGLRRGRAPRRPGDPHARPGRRRPPRRWPSLPPDLRDAAGRLRGGRERVHRGARATRCRSSSACCATRPGPGSRRTPSPWASSWPWTSPRAGTARRSAPRSAIACRPTCRTCSSRRCSRTTASSSATTRAGRRRAGVRRARGDASQAATTGWSPGPTPPRGMPLLANDPHLGLGMPVDLDRRPPHRTRPRRRGGDAARRAGRDPRPQPRRGLGLHQRPRRRRRPLRRGVRSAGPGPLPGRATAGSA